MTLTTWLRRITITLLSCGLTALSAQADDTSSQSYELDIDALPLTAAVKTLSDETGIEVLFFSEIAEGVTSSPVQGEYTPTEALETMLNSTDLKVVDLKKEGAVAIAMTATDERGASDSKNLKPQPVLMAQNQTSPTTSTESGRQSSEGVTGIVTGKVTDARTGANLKGAKVTIEETGQWVSTNDLGEFRLVNVPTGSATLTVSYLGYEGQSEVVGIRSGSASQNFALRGGSEIDEILVFGQRSARAQALNLERTSENVTSIVSSDELGNFPGTTISEALRRTPGITFQRDREGTGDGTNIIIRGLEPNLNAVKLNDVTLAVSNGRDRTADLGNLLADSIEQVKISKTLLPSHDSAGTGGLVEIETKSPLDRPRRFASVRAESAFSDGDFLKDELYSATLSGLFGHEENLGFSVSTQYREREVSSIQFSTGLQFGQFLPLESDGSTSITSGSLVDPRVPFPFEPLASNAYINSATTSFADVATRNFSITGTAEAEIGNHTNLRLDFQRSKLETDDLSRRVAFDVFGTNYGERPVAALGGEVRQALAWDGSVSSVRQNYRVSTNEEDVIDTLSLRGRTNLGPWDVKYQLGRSDGESKLPSSLSFGLAYSGPTALDPSFVAQEAIDPVEGIVLSLFAPNPSGSTFPLPLLTEAGYGEFNNSDRYTFSNSPTLGGNAGSNQVESFRGSLRRAFEDRALEYIEFGTFAERSEFGNRITSTGAIRGLTDQTLSSQGLRFDSNSLGSIGQPQSLSALAESTVNSFARGLPTNEAIEGDITFEDQSEFLHPENGNQFTQEETLAAYIQASASFGRLSIVGGARFNRTDIVAANLVTPTVLFSDFTGLTAEEQLRLSSVIRDEASETDVLPRLLLNYRHSENLIVRGGYFQTIARPNVSQLSSDKRFTLLLIPFFGPNNNQPLLQVTEGNPELEPARTHNFDASLELYDDNIGVMKLGLFYKRIENLLESTATDVSNELSSIDLPDDPIFTDNVTENTFVVASKPVNANRDAEIWGLEAAIERQFVSLPGVWSGLGLLANYTYTDSSKTEQFSWLGSPVFDDTGALIGRESIEIGFDDVRFAQQPQHSGTLAMTYNYDNWDASLAYTSQSRRLSAFFPNELSRYDSEEDSLDLRVEYWMDFAGASFRVYLEGQDLLSDSEDITLSTQRGGEGRTPEFSQNGTYFGGRIVRAGVFVTF